MNDAVKYITVLHGTTIYDLALRYYGNVQHAQALATLNGFENGVDQILTVGQKIQVPQRPNVPQADLTVVNFFESRKLEVNSGLAEEAAGDGCVFEDDVFEDGVFGCDETTTVDELTYWTNFLDKAGLLNKIVAGRNRSITSVLSPGKTQFMIYATADEVATFNSVETINIASYIIKVNEVAVSLPFELKEHDELLIDITPTDPLMKSWFAQTGEY